jgi:hypothetical protein
MGSYLGKTQEDEKEDELPISEEEDEDEEEEEEEVTEGKADKVGTVPKGAIAQKKTPAIPQNVKKQASTQPTPNGMVLPDLSFYVDKEGPVEGSSSPSLRRSARLLEKKTGIKCTDFKELDSKGVEVLAGGKVMGNKNAAAVVGPVEGSSSPSLRRSARLLEKKTGIKCTDFKELNGKR